MSKGIQGNAGVEIIGGFKLVKAIALLVTAVVLPIAGKHQIEFLFGLAQHLSVDPNARYFQAFVRKFVELSPKFPLISVGMAVYGAIFAVEGVGLLLRKRWAEYLTAIVTGSFLPLEFYEIIHHTTAVKGAVIALNVAILIYLVARIRSRRKKDEGAARSFAAAQPK